MKNIKIEIKWALIFVVMMLAWMVMEKSLGWHDEKIADHAVLTNLVAIPSIAIYIFALLDKRKNFYHGVISYYQGFMAGLVITLIVAILSPLVQYITSEFITPNFFTNVINYSVSIGEMTQDKAESYFNLQSYMIMSVVGALIMGIATSAVVAVLVKSKSKPSAFSPK
ncbi:DUF4199 domain-containing protein [Algoriphagus sp. C2-6-M1]|uniref:DUF4199 domain-containing protein n=1 Tax=Algoriphagus persicinus TaxID=3108754 RepID=UPI002B3FDAF5|nr:DUF4199 domain-containing protein [Algoriphagus sp. C2-6-M1]MEB2781899.1 DUF4199 domain-containing protein [Algoriphagus sp. C2-6-M1]